MFISIEAILIYGTLQKLIRKSTSLFEYGVEAKSISIFLLYSAIIEISFSESEKPFTKRLAIGLSS